MKKIKIREDLNPHIILLFRIMREFKTGGAICGNEEVKAMQFVQALAVGINADDILNADGFVLKALKEHKVVEIVDSHLLSPSTYAHLITLSKAYKVVFL